MYIMTFAHYEHDHVPQTMQQAHASLHACAETSQGGARMAGSGCSRQLLMEMSKSRRERGGVLLRTSRYSWPSFCGRTRQQLLVLCPGM